MGPDDDRPLLQGTDLLGRFDNMDSALFQIGNHFCVMDDGAVGINVASPVRLVIYFADRALHSKAEPRAAGKDDFRFAQVSVPFK